jgi:hypothetical protein
MLLVLSTSAIDSSYVEAEWHTFFNMGRKIIPLILDKCEVPLFLRTFHQIDFSHVEAFADQVKHLLTVLPSHLEKTGVHKPTNIIETLEKTLPKKPLPEPVFPSENEILAMVQSVLDDKAITLRDAMIQVILPIDEVILQYPFSAEMTIGRNHHSSQFQPTIDLIAYKNGGMVSRNHATLCQSGKILYIKDNNSSNGTYIHELNLVPHEYYPLENHSLVYLSRHFPVMIHYRF